MAMSVTHAKLKPSNAWSFPNVNMVHLLAERQRLGSASLLATDRKDVTDVTASGAREPREVDTHDVLRVVRGNRGLKEREEVPALRPVVAQDIPCIADAACPSQEADGFFRVRIAGIVPIEAIVTKTLRAAVVIVDDAGELYSELI